MALSPRKASRALVAPALLGAVASLLIAAAACSDREPASSSEAQLVVFAAASLREPFGALAEALKEAHPGRSITFNFAGSQELRAQIEHGAAADVFASADMRHMHELVRAERVRTPFVFARNELVIVVAREHAARLATVADLPHAERIVIGAPEVPVGRYTAQFLEKASHAKSDGDLGPDFVARVNARVVSRELNVKQVLAKVLLGEADAGIVYRSDVGSAQLAGGVGVVAIPPKLNATAEYPIAMLRDAKHPQLAQAWLNLVRSDAGQRALMRAGFLAPEQSVATQ
jgi:molybdate transport system substrate-binding protein